MKRNLRMSAPSDRHLACILAFLLPILLMIGIFVGNQIFPFGDRSFLRTDMYHQYAPFFADFARRLKEGRDLSYTFEIGLGSNYMALYAYYLSSPINWLVFLCPSGLILEFMTYLIVLKTGICGFAMTRYLQAHFRTGHMSTAFFGILYAMSGFMAAYSWNIMWLDCLWLAPLIILGLERLIQKNQPFLYAICLGLAILCNYYIAIMLCIFMVLCFLCEMILLPRMTLKEYAVKTGLFALFSLLAGGLAGILLIPAAKALMTTASADSTFPSSLTSYFSVLEMLARHMMTVEVETGLDHWPNIYSGVACFFLVPAYILNKKVPAKEKIVRICLLMFMLLSFSLNIPNYIWHGMHYPNSLPCRQSFLYTIVLLTICFEGLRGLKDLTPGQLIGIFWGDAAFLLLCQTVITSEEVPYYAVYLSLLFVALYALTAWTWRRSKLVESTAVILMLVLVMAETGINMAVTSVTTVGRSDYWKNVDNYQELLKIADMETDGTFYRTEKPSRRTKNDGAWTDYASASNFSSTAKAAITDFYKDFGMEGSTNAYSFTGGTPLMASLLSVRYMISPSELTETNLMEYVAWEDTAYLYRNKYTLPLAFMMPGDVSGYLNFYTGTPAEAQNTLVSLSTGSGPVLTEVTRNTSGDSFSWTVEEKGLYYAYVHNRSVKDVTAHLGASDKDFERVDRGYLLNLGSRSLGETITLTSEEGETMDATIYRFEEDSFIHWYETVSQEAMTDATVTSTRGGTTVTGTIQVKTDGMLFTSIPYEEGWEVKVDGQDVSELTFADTFLCLQLSAGTHEITMTYHTPGLMSGVLLSLASLLILVLLALFSHLRDTRLRSLAQARRREQFHTAAGEEESSEEILLEDEEFLEEPPEA